jgi:TetR/AcrR family transcriptional regulator, cholesterol catabolism regulator
MAEPVSPNLLTEDQLARRQRIIDAGLVLLERNEYERIQIKDVAEEADVALGTLYHYFSSKEHLFAEVLIKWAATLKSSLARHPPQGLTPREKLTGALHRSVRAFQHQPQLARLIASLELSSDPFATEILERMDQTTSSVYMELLDGVEPRRARTIVRTVDAVLDSHLRAWSAGRLSITGLYDYLSESIDLIFEGDPEVTNVDSREHRKATSLGDDGVG